jgi:hypothetical protein
VLPRLTASWENQAKSPRMIPVVSHGLENIRVTIITSLHY